MTLWLARPRQAAGLFAGGLATRGRFRLLVRPDQLLQLARDVVARLDLLQWNPAVDSLAHEPVIVGNRAGERVAERLLEVVAPQPGAEHPLLETIDDDLRIDRIAEPFADRRNQLLAVAKPRHGGFGDDVELVRSD